MGGSEAHGFGDGGSVFGVAGVELGVENARLIGVGFDDEEIQVETVAHVEGAGDVDVVDGPPITVDELGVPVVKRADLN